MPTQVRHAEEDGPSVQGPSPAQGSYELRAPVPCQQLRAALHEAALLRLQVENPTNLCYMNSWLVALTWAGGHLPSFHDLMQLLRAILHHGRGNLWQVFAAYLVQSERPHVQHDVAEFAGHSLSASLSVQEHGRQGL